MASAPSNACERVNLAKWDTQSTGILWFPASPTLDVFETRRSSPPGSAPVSLFAPHLSGNSQLGRQYAVSRNGQRFLVNTPKEVMLPITVVLNWKPTP